MKCRFDEQAAAEVRAIARFYVNENRELGIRFVEELYRALELLHDNPELGQQLANGLRRLLLSGFPYRVIYQVDATTRVIRIIAVCHYSRRPDYWKNRVQEVPALYAVAA
ncbi:MAG: type II toxin-antitoxin system RelE/ParE family toxin [Gammaproteobacteria bacterium]